MDYAPEQHGEAVAGCPLSHDHNVHSLKYTISKTGKERMEVDGEGWGDIIDFVEL